MDFEKLYNWENMPVSSIIYVMVKWLNIQNVEFTTKRRDNVESGIWYDITAQDENYTHIFNISSQNMSLLKNRLIEALDKKGYRDNLKNKKDNGTDAKD